MRLSWYRLAIASVAPLALAAGLTACGGSTAAIPVFTAPQASAPFALGLVAADPADIAQLAEIRHVLGVAALPSAIDLSSRMPAVGNQGHEGSCVAWASAYAMRGYEAREDIWLGIGPKSSDPALNFSPSFVYNQTNGGRDAGIPIPAALALMRNKGAATLADMPYIAGQFTTQPAPAAFADAARHKLSAYGHIAPADLTSMKVQLAAGIPVILAIKVYYNFFDLRANQVYTAMSGAYQGGHAVTIVGYDDAKGAVEVINSWGTSWGTGGYGWISYPALAQITMEAYSAIDDHGAPPRPRPAATPKPAPAAPQIAAPKPKPTPAPKPTSAPKK